MRCARLLNTTAIASGYASSDLQGGTAIEALGKFFQVTKIG